MWSYPHINTINKERKKEQKRKKGCYYCHTLTFTNFGLDKGSISKCNLRCRHCFWNSHKELLPTGTNKDIVNTVKMAIKKYPSITNITWYGEEPLIDDEMIELKYAKTKDYFYYRCYRICWL